MAISTTGKQKWMPGPAPPMRWKAIPKKSTSTCASYLPNAIKKPKKLPASISTTILNAIAPAMVISTSNKTTAAAAYESNHQRNTDYLCGICLLPVCPAAADHFPAGADCIDHRADKDR